MQIYLGNKQVFRTRAVSAVHFQSPVMGSNPWKSFFFSIFENFLRAMGQRLAQSFLHIPILFPFPFCVWGGTEKESLVSTVCECAGFSKILASEKGASTLLTFLPIDDQIQTSQGGIL